MFVMPTFIDESGETGHSQTSSPYFRLAAVWMPSLEEAEAFRESIRRLPDDRPDLYMNERVEFKFFKTHTRPDIREAFFHLALLRPFRFAFCSIDKTRGRWRNAPAHEQHWLTATDIAASLRGTYHADEATHPERPLRDPIIVDDNKDRRFLDTIQIAFQGLRSNLHPHIGMVRNPRFRGSDPDEMMQLVDMVCGASGACVDGDRRWYNLIRQRCVGMNTW